MSSTEQNTENVEKNIADEMAEDRMLNKQSNAGDTEVP